MKEEPAIKNVCNNVRKSSCLTFTGFYITPFGAKLLVVVQNRVNLYDVRIVNIVKIKSA